MHKTVLGKLVFMKKECLYQNLGSSDTGKCLYIALPSAKNMEGEDIILLEE